MAKQAASRQNVNEQKVDVKEMNESILDIKRVIRVEPIVRDRGHLHNNKDTQFLCEGCYIGFGLNTNEHTGSLDNPFKEIIPIDGERGEFDRALTDEEIERLAEYFGIKAEQFNPKHEDSFWKRYEVKLSSKGKILHMNRFEDFVAYRVMRSNIYRFCLGRHNTNVRQEFKYVLINEKDEREFKLDTDSLIQESWTEYGKMITSDDKMYDFLLAYWFYSNDGIKPLETMDGQEMRLLISDIIKKNPKRFMFLVSDPKINTKILIQKGLMKEQITMSGSDYVYGNFTGSVDSLIKFLDDVRNQEEKAKLIALVDKK